jgi:hypothetical protein
MTLSRAFCHASSVLLAGWIMTAATAWAADAPAVPPPSAAHQAAARLEQVLAEALENHPEILAAKAKLALAEAQLNSARLEVARQVIALAADIENQKLAAGDMRRRLETLKPANKEHAETTRALIDVEAKLARLNTELRFLTAQNAAASAAHQPPPVVPLQIPSGPRMGEIREGLERKSSLEFVATPLGDVLEYLADAYKLPVTRDAARLPRDAEAVDLKLKDVRAIEALQAIQDQCQTVRFVVRDYGILATDRGYSDEQGYLPVTDFLTRAADGHQAKK